MSWLVKPKTNEPAALRLRRHLEAEEALLAPGVFNALVALEAERQGFKALYFSGGAYAASLGLPDVGLLTLEDVVHGVRWVTRAVDLPVIVDADTGFGGALNVARAVRELEAVGAAAIQIEDQVMPKRCGHLAGKAVVAAEVMAEKIAAARRAREHLVIVARTDARGPEGFEAAVARAELYLKAGADVVFPEALESAAEFRAFARRVRAPLLANMTEFGRSPLVPAARLFAWGYRIVIFPVTALRAAMKAVEGVLAALRREGSAARWVPRMQTRAELYALLGYAAYEALDRSLGEASDAP
ncbi:methylisocitrate lyase [Marinithermus hydrothermalis]|uniref:Methylisocitrate lyase n=1 Tax=Marinithermus hydrothermalis (strain DSM 14884 / JCM 11576 / T1) TaxID=869210 RepID=F2NN84_MARHT|nr:methylisocitrate lyase [Marinithermus hydrothermalis]AEB10925.1 methylisocitrate lyase [Marinithermus hydrothermalis DSM 14884]